MTWIAALGERLRGLFRRGREDADTAEEMAFHVDMEADRLVREEGLDPAEAHRRAAVAFGGVEKYREATRDARGFTWLSNLSLDLKLGARLLVKFPGLTVVGGLGMAVGIAVSLGFAIFLMANAYPDIPLPEGDRIVALENRDIERHNEDRRALHDFFTWREELRTVEDLGAFRDVTRTLVAGEGTPEPVLVAEMTAAGFSVARTPTLMGRHLEPEDEREGSPAVVVIGYDVWHDRFAADPEIVGRDLRLGRLTHTVIGVMPEGFAFPMQHQYWIPLRENPLDFERREGPAIYIFGRLAPGISLDEARLELEAIGQRTAAAFPETHARIRPMVMPYVHSLFDIQGMTFWRLSQMQSSVTLLLIVIALNVAVLMYARTATRRSEIAVRTALGASRRRIVGQLFLEALLLATASAIVGVVLARLGVRLGSGIMEAEMGRPFWQDYRLRPVTVAWTIGLVLLAAGIIGVVPGLQATGRSLKADMTRLGSGSDMRLGKVWTTLIVAQIAIAVMSLPMATAMGLQEVRFAMSRLTFPAEEVVNFVLETESDGEAVSETDRVEATSRFGAGLAEVMRRIEADPAVAHVAFSGGLPDRIGRIRIEGVPAPEESPGGHRVITGGISDGYFDVFDVRLLSGRAFGRADFDGSTAAVVVDEVFVRDVLGGGNALGRRVRFVSRDELAGEATPAAPRWFEVVGVIRGLSYNRVAPEMDPAIVYYPLAPAQTDHAVVAVRLRRPGQPDIGNRIADIVAQVDPALQPSNIWYAEDALEEGERAVRLTALALTLVGLSVLLLSGGGIYALMSFTVTRRRAEIGIRAALGARPGQLLGAIFARAAAQVGSGLGIGVGLALVLNAMNEDEFMDEWTMILLPAFAIVMGATGLMAAWGPARRGLRVEPAEALRAE
jgi:predicted permease